jgi:1-deoxy-D-xylulose-5-phosphate reductoisomerase
LYDNEEMNAETSRPVRLAVLGSTGSIGNQTLEIVRALPSHFQVVGLAAGENQDLLRRQVAEFKPKLVCLSKHPGHSSLGEGWQNAQPCRLEEMAADPEVDIVVIATAGGAGLTPLLAAIKAQKKIALSNKEPLVMAGEIVLAEMKNSQGWILPVDSEHSAIWQCMAGESLKPRRIILTASGGPFLHLPLSRLAKVGVKEALHHPSWQMGKKVTIDSATLMNKGLEVIEAHWLFDVDFPNIDILIHPQSIVHSMVELVDGSVKAQLSSPDMRLPIQYALSYPERIANPSLPSLDWSAIKQLRFEQPDYSRFPCLKLAIEAGKKGGTYPAVLCGSDDAAVESFLAGKIGFNQIAETVAGVLEKHQTINHPGLEEILAADQWAREEARRWIDRQIR